MSSTTRWRALRRAAAVVAGATAITLVSASAALAFNSGGNPQNFGGTGPNHIEWTGQGGVSASGTGDCLNEVTGQPDNTPFIYWVLAPDGGSVQVDSTTPVLHLGGTGNGDYVNLGGDSDTGPHAVKFITPFFPLNGLTASATMNVLDTGNGSWNLVISHGCAAPTITQAPPPTVTKDASAAYTTTYQWNITKKADETQIDVKPGGTATAHYTVVVTNTGSSSGDVSVSGNITVTNPGSLPVSLGNGGSVVDHLIGDGDHGCQLTNGPPDSLAPGSNVLPYTCTIPAADFDPNSPLQNKVTVTWADQMLDASHHLAAGTASKAIDVTPQQNLVDNCVTPSDPQAPAGTFTQVCVGDSPATFHYSVDHPAPDAGTCHVFDNTATISDANGDLGSDSAHVKVCSGADLVVTKDATPKFQRIYAWNITKAVDKTKVSQVGGSATFHYTVNVTHDNGTDSGWAVTGKITVTNPNDWEDINLTGLTDAIDNGGNCSLDSQLADPTTIPAGGSKDFTYTCTYASAPSPASGTNTAKATWDADAAFTTDGSASGTATATFTDPTTVKDDHVAVNDSLKGFLGTVGLNDSNPPPFTYDLTFQVPANGCQSHNNTAIFTTNTTGTTGSASQSVQVCGPAKTGALTIGYWQNKNGQSIITNGASTAGVCNSGTWLRQYAPFQDLSSTATCSQVAAYFVTVFKAANASGASMNAMLKAQSLATALDVYFSDPALGGNKISAPAPVGGVGIDLTQICKMIDGSGGTATCSGVYENVGPAFGGATSLTVSQMLSYAAGQSNAGGSAWYGQVKATQQLAKDAFDAINNQVAFGA
jgi:hypothetical protein